jgi:LEA14-like dessication related protein
MKILIRYLFLLLFILNLSGCAELAKHAGAIKPTAKVVNMQLTSIDFKQADLLFDFAVENRNPVPVHLSGINYDLKIENQSLVSGVTAQSIEVKADATSHVHLPVSLKFDDLRKLPKAMRGKDSLVYQLETSFKFNFPVIGNFAIPVSKQGEVPVPRLPGIRIKDVKIKNLNLTAAELVALVEVDNPNAFTLALGSFDYRLNINRQSWGQGSINQAVSIPEKGSGAIELPLKLNLMSMGASVYNVLVNKHPLAYQLTGGMTVDTGLSMLHNYKMPLDIKGVTALQ